MCVFCEIAKGNIPSKTVYENEYFKVILDIAPICEGHTLVIPKEHFENIFDMPDSFAGRVMETVKKAAEIVGRAYGKDMNIIQNNGEVAGQSCMHYHVHIVPRHANDGILLPESNRNNDIDLDAVLSRLVGD